MPEGRLQRTRDGYRESYDRALEVERIRRNVDNIARRYGWRPPHEREYDTATDPGDEAA